MEFTNFASKKLLKDIIDYVYEKSIDDPSKLNDYKPFTSETYGESKFELIDMMIIEAKQLSPNKFHRFIDLGSGVGQVVLQMAGSLELDACIGIEIREIPAKYATQLDLNFRKLMDWFGKKYSNYKIINGDFTDAIHQPTIQASSIVYANNYSFESTLNLKLNELFKGMDHDALVISSKKLCSTGHSTHKRYKLRPIY